MFLKAFEEANGNAFQQVYAMGALCELYELTQDRKNLKRHSSSLWNWWASCRQITVAVISPLQSEMLIWPLNSFQDSADPAKVAQGLADVEAVKQGAIQPGKVSQGLGKSLFAFPAKFE